MRLLVLVLNVFTITILGVNCAHLDEEETNINRKMRFPLTHSESKEEDVPQLRGIANWDQSSFGINSPNSQRGERRRKKIERRMERQERRQERRKHRHRLHNLEKDESQFYPSRPESLADSNYFKKLTFKEPELPQINNVKTPAGSNSIGWLENNITSIWYTLQFIQRDIKQIRRQIRANNGQGRGSKKASEAESKNQNASELCDPHYEGEPNSCIDEHGLVCGEKGECICGQCKCQSPYYGIRCRCNDMICERSGGVLCGGAGRGQCRCGACVCRPEFTGSSCDCSMSTSDCRKGTGDICNGKGSCVCNRCQCQDGYTGKYCEESIYSATICERIKPCVLCLAYGKMYPQCEDCNIKVKMVEELESSRATCLMVNLGCILKYAYITPQVEGEDMTVLVKKDRSCS